jgi:RPA family protein
MVKLVGAVWNYDEGTKNTKINVEDGTGLVQVMLWHEQNECSAAAALYCACKVNSYICVIGEVRSYFKMKEIMVFDVCPVSSGNELMYHLLEVAYLFEKIMEYFEDKEFNTVDIDRFICKQKEAIVKQKGGPMKSNGK